MINSKIWLVPATCMLLLTSACGDDDSSSGSGSGSSADGYSSFEGALAEGGGLITGFGSVVIDGVRYETGNTVPEDLNGADISADTLEVGMRVDFEAKLSESDDTGFINKLVISDQVSGPLHSADVVGKKIYIFGDEIVFNDDTVFANFASENLVTELLQDVHVSVSGYRDSTGLLTATLIRKLNPATAKLQIEGTISHLTTSDSGPSSFQIRGMTFTFTDDSAEIIKDGNVVKVTFASYTAGTPMPMTDIKLAKAETRELEADRKLVMRGPIATADGDNNVFTIGKVTVKYDVNTNYQDGVVTDLKPGTIVVVKGTIVVNEPTTANALADADAKVLQAREIMVHKPTDQFIEGKITAITTAAAGKTITVDGKQFELTRRAQIRNKLQNKSKNVFDSLAQNEFVAISYYATTGDTPKNIVTKLKRVDTSPTGFDVDTVTYKLKASNLKFKSGTSAITYDNLDYATDANTKIINHFTESTNLTAIKTIIEKSEHANWIVLFTVKKAADPANHQVLAIKVESLPADNHAVFVTKIAQGTTNSGDTYKLNYGKSAVYTIGAATTALQTFTAVNSVANNEQRSAINASSTDSSVYNAIKTARVSNDVFIKISGTMSSGSFNPVNVLIYVQPAGMAEFAKSMPHSLD